MTQSETGRPIFIGKWTPKILLSLRERPYRHGHLRRRLGGIAQRMLTRNLRRLESSGLVSRRVSQSKAITVEYALTQPGRALVAPLRAVCRWAERHHREVTAEVHVSRPAQS